MSTHGQFRHTTTPIHEERCRCARTTRRVRTVPTHAPTHALGHPNSRTPQVLSQYAQLSLFLSLIAAHLYHTSRPTICGPRVSLIYLRIPPCAPFAARLCGQERLWRYSQYLSDTYRWTRSQTIVRAAIHDCGTHGSRCLHCCRDGSSSDGSHQEPKVSLGQM